MTNPVDPMDPVYDPPVEAGDAGDPIYEDTPTFTDPPSAAVPSDISVDVALAVSNPVDSPTVETVESQDDNAKVEEAAFRSDTDPTNAPTIRDAMGDSVQAVADEEAVFRAHTAPLADIVSAGSVSDSGDPELSHDPVPSLVSDG